MNNPNDRDKRVGYWYNGWKRLFMSMALTEKEGAGALLKLFAQAAGLALEMKDFSDPSWRVRYLIAAREELYLSKAKPDRKELETSA